MNLTEIARSFGLRVIVDRASTRLRRGAFEVVLGEALTVNSLTRRNRAWCACLGVRLGLDRLIYAEEAWGAGDGPAPQDLYERHAPSGERLARLLPSAVIALAGGVAGYELMSREWVAAAPFQAAFVLPHGRHLLALGRKDHLPAGEDAMVEDARRALFYEAYRVRPQRDEKLPHARLRRFEARGGLGSSLGVLLPDFDLDTARARGMVMLPDYNRLVAWRPGQTARPSQLRDVGRAELRDAALPFSRRIYHLRTDGIIAGETCDATAEFNPSDLALNLIEVRHD